MILYICQQEDLWAPKCYCWWQIGVLSPLLAAIEKSEGKIRHQPGSRKPETSKTDQEDHSRIGTRPLAEIQRCRKMACDKEKQESTSWTRRQYTIRRRHRYTIQCDIRNTNYRIFVQEDIIVTDNDFAGGRNQESINDISSGWCDVLPWYTPMTFGNVSKWSRSEYSVVWKRIKTTKE